MAKKYVNEDQVADLHKFCKRELKSASYWFIRLTRVDVDSENMVTTEQIVHKNKLKTKIQLNAAAKPSAPSTKPSVTTATINQALHNLAAINAAAALSSNW
jgi:hypothetical protein